MKIRSFAEYSNARSNDPATFSKRVAIATHELTEHSLFSIVSRSSELSEEHLDLPVIIDSGFSIEPSVINEGSSYVYNRISTPTIEDIVDRLSSNPYVPKLSSSIKDIKKKFRFPIIATNSTGSKEFKTIGKLKASNTNYSSFRENPTAKTRFKILAFKGKPISIVEWINRFPIDVDMNSFEYLNESNDISSIIYEKFDAELCNIEIIESIKGDIIIRSVSNKLDLNPIQEKAVYESVYEDYYQSSLPGWFKKTVFKEYIAEYCKQKQLDSHLINSIHALDYSKLSK